MDLQLKDKVVLITGGAKGIGAAITRGAWCEGAVVIFVDKDAEAGEGLESELRKQGARGAFICADLIPPDNCRATLEQALREFGRLDALINNVGVNDGV